MFTKIFNKITNWFKNLFNRNKNIVSDTVRMKETIIKTEEQKTVSIFSSLIRHLPSIKLNLFSISLMIISFFILYFLIIPVTENTNTAVLKNYDKLASIYRDTTGVLNQDNLKKAEESVNNVETNSKAISYIDILVKSFLLTTISGLLEFIR